MDLVITGVVAGVLGTVIMDSLNLLFSRAGILSKIEVGVIGRMAAGWAHGRFRYEHPNEMEQTANETLYGYVTHYAYGQNTHPNRKCPFRKDLWTSDTLRLWPIDTPNVMPDAALFLAPFLGFRG